jgi:hypothetical protein
LTRTPFKKEGLTMEASQTHAGLRTWAKGIYPLEAGVELLIRSSDGRFAAPGWPWIAQGAQPGSWWLDVTQMNEDAFVALSGGETRSLRVAAALLGGEPVDLYENIAGLDRDHVTLVLAAIAHASGSHEHSGPPIPDPQGRYTANGVRVSLSKLPSLFPWPDRSGSGDAGHSEATPSAWEHAAPPAAGHPRHVPTSTQSAIGGIQL